MEELIDLRSDTVTRPTPEMRAAMAAAEVGDDVYGEDPTVNLLEKRAAEIFGREAALFVPTGTMGNQIGIRLHTEPGQEVICESRVAHSGLGDGDRRRLLGMCDSRRADRKRHLDVERHRAGDLWTQLVSCVDGTDRD